MNVAIIGASNNPERFAHRAQERLMQEGHATFPVNPGGGEILGRKVYPSISEIPPGEHPVHTAVIYLRPERFTAIAEEVLACRPSRVIFNPGTENPEIAERYRSTGVHVVEACTLVLLEEGRFDSA